MQRDYLFNLLPLKKHFLTSEAFDKFELYHLSIPRVDGVSLYLFLKKSFLKNKKKLKVFYSILYGYFNPPSAISNHFLLPLGLRNNGV